MLLHVTTAPSTQCRACVETLSVSVCLQLWDHLGAPSVKQVPLARPCDSHSKQRMETPALGETNTRGHRDQKQHCNAPLLFPPLLSMDIVDFDFYTFKPKYSTVRPFYFLNLFTIVISCTPVIFGE